MAETASTFTQMSNRVQIDAAGCWIWQGARSHDGYGHVRVAGRVVGAHRGILLARGDVIPPGMEVDHLCRVTLCINPDHLEIVTPAENLRRKYAAMTHCKHGHPFDAENTIIRTDKINFGRRQCRECQRKAVRESMRRHRAAAKALRRSNLDAAPGTAA